MSQRVKPRIGQFFSLFFSSRSSGLSDKPVLLSFSSTAKTGDVRGYPRHGPELQKRIHEIFPAYFAGHI